MMQVANQALAPTDMLIKCRVVSPNLEWWRICPTPFLIVVFLHTMYHTYSMYVFVFDYTEDSLADT